MGNVSIVGGEFYNVECASCRTVDDVNGLTRRESSRNVNNDNVSVLINIITDWCDAIIISRDIDVIIYLRVDVNNVGFINLRRNLNVDVILDELVTER